MVLGPGPACASGRFLHLLKTCTFATCVVLLLQTLASNLERLERERDASVVGELCKQHKRVLITMAENHKKQTEAVQFALNGKNDFMGNLHMRFA